MTEAGHSRRALFMATILTGSFLLFLIQPMVARMALPRLGGAPNVWNSAMLVYQALLLAGYFYAHRLARMPLARQARIHLALIALAAVTLPVALIDLPQPAAGAEVFWVPALFALSIGPIFLLVSAQAPLMQRWYAADPAAGEPWALYAASNLGSFAGLIAYPLLVEPLLALRAQAWLWTAGYATLAVFIYLSARARRGLAQTADAPQPVTSPPVPARRITLWLALSAVPSGLMLSTTTHLTTDLIAMPLLWVIPLGLYLLSFVIAFAERRGAAQTLALLAWPAVLTTGTMAMVSEGSNGLLPVAGSLVLLLLFAVALHARLYDARPDPDRLTFFYLIMAAGGVLGGLFTALLAPLAFDWVWEHPLLVLLGTALLPWSRRLDWRLLPGMDRQLQRILQTALIGFGVLCCWQVYSVVSSGGPRTLSGAWMIGVTLAGLMLTFRRAWVTALLLGAMLAQGGTQTLADSHAGLRTRSYFGIYTVRDRPSEKLRTLAHGTTLHGQQSSDPALRHMPLSYYGPGSGVGIAFSHAADLFGPAPRVAVVGLGAGTLACYRRAGASWTFFEIDPAVLAYSQRGTFTYLRDCAPRARVVLGDARIELEKVPPGSFDLLAIDAFSSDAIPLHLMTDEALGVYERALSPRGILLIHISNRFIDLEPVLGAEARRRGLSAALRDDNPPANSGMTGSSWVALSRDRARLKALAAQAPALVWRPLSRPAARGWSDDHASILPYVQWRNFLGSPQ